MIGSIDATADRENSRVRQLQRRRRLRLPVRFQARDGRLLHHLVAHEPLNVHARARDVAHVCDLGFQLQRLIRPDEVSHGAERRDGDIVDLRRIQSAIDDFNRRRHRGRFALGSQLSPGSDAIRMPTACLTIRQHDDVPPGELFVRFQMDRRLKAIEQIGGAKRRLGRLDEILQLPLAACIGADRFGRRPLASGGEQHLNAVGTG